MHTSHAVSLLVLAAVAASPLAAQDTTHTKVAASASTHGAAVSTVAKTNDTTRARARHRRHHYTAAELQAMAKISKDSATVIALAQVPNGTVTESELEYEHRTAVYSYDITVPGKSGVDEVLVSAVDGHIVWKGHESARHERTEQRADNRAATKKPATDTTKKP